MQKKYGVKIEGGEEIHLQLEVSGDTIEKQSWQVVGGFDLIQLVQALYNQNIQRIQDFPEPQGLSSSVLLLKELILRVKGQWVEGDQDMEVCHCRKISEAAIDRAILLGAHNLEKVRKRTSANTGCGACMADVQSLISKRVSGSF